MQTVALAEDWDLTRATALLDQAVLFEPDYYTTTATTQII
jgi:hypothetical protein